MASKWWDTTTRLSWGVPFAVDATGNWRDVNGVDRGKACGCYCAECESPLIARMGEVRIHHFAHEGRRECRQALETSLFGMAIDLLGQPGAVASPAPAPTAAVIAGRIGQPLARVEAALRELGTKLEEFGQPLSLQNPTVFSRFLRTSSMDQPDLVDEASGLAIHLLSSRKPFPELAEKSRGGYARILVINPLVFARGWQVVCSDQATEVATISSSRELFRAWLATSLEGRGWLANAQEKDLEAQVNQWIVAHPPPPPAPAASRYSRPGFLQQTSIPSAMPIRAAVPAPRLDQPNRTLRMDVGVCPVCRGPQDLILQGSGYYAGTRLQVCRQNPRHPLTHRGRDENLG